MGGRVERGSCGTHELEDRMEPPWDLIVSGASWLSGSVEDLFEVLGNFLKWPMILGIIQARTVPGSSGERD